ncbi:MAG: hypothetical protein ABIE75_04910 [Candidatus Omnitrophota bacterium]
MKAVKGGEILFIGEDKVGLLEDVTSAIKNSGVNIRSIAAWADSGKAFFKLITSDNVKVKEILLSKGTVDEKEVIIVEITDKIGQLHSLASKLKDNNINLCAIHGATYEPGKSAIIVFSSDNNDKALKIISV